MSTFSLATCSNCLVCRDCPTGITLTYASGNVITSLEVCDVDTTSNEEYEQAVDVIEA